MLKRSLSAATKLMYGSATSKTYAWPAPFTTIGIVGVVNNAPVVVPDTIQYTDITPPTPPDTCVMCRLKRQVPPGILRTLGSPDGVANSISDTSAPGLTELAAPPAASVEGDMLAT